jgi:hypothetical protein
VGKPPEFSVDEIMSGIADISCCDSKDSGLYDVLQARGELCKVLQDNIPVLSDVVESAVGVVACYPMSLAGMRVAEELQGDLDAKAQFGVFLDMPFANQLSVASIVPDA